MLAAATETPVALADSFSEPQSPDFRLLFESAPGLYLVLTPELEIVGASDAFLRATMTKRADVVGRCVFEVFPDNHDDPAVTGVRNLSHSLARVLKDKTSDAMAIQKYDIRRPDSEGGGFEERYWRPANYPVFGSHNEVAYILHKADDVTEFFHLKQRGIEQDELNHELLNRGVQMEAEIVLGAQEIQSVNRQLCEAHDVFQKDIAGRFPAEEKLRQIHEKLDNCFQASTADLASANEKLVQLAAIVESCEDAIISETLDGCISSWNQAAMRMCGYSAHEVFGRPVSFLLPQQFVEVFQQRRAAVRTGQSFRDFDTEFIRQDGRPVSVSLSISPIKDKTGEVIGISTIARDISERKQMTAELAQRDEQLRQSQKLEAVGSLAGGIAHEFNNLLQTIRGFAKYAMEGLAPSQQRYQDLEQVIKAADRAAVLTKQLLGFSRRQVLERRYFDHREVVTDVMNMLQPLIGDQIELEMSLASDVAPVCADRGLLHQMLLNLCINARDAMPAGGRLMLKTERVSLNERYCELHPTIQPGCYLMFSIIDNGCGMPPDVKERIFEPFFTTKGVGKGTGLGLAMVYGCVQQHGGVVNVYSEVGLGTTFRIYLPITAGADSIVNEEVTALAVGGTETILVAEDEPMVRELTVRILTDAGYSVLIAADGAEAVVQIDTYGGAISLALLDAVMPKLTGRQVYDRIKVSNPDLPVVFCSGYAPGTCSVKSLVDEGLVLVQKPYHPDVLLRIVRDALDSRHALKASSCSA